MSEYDVRQIYRGDSKGSAGIKALLESEGIRLDANLDYTCAIYGGDYNVIAAGSCFGSTLRCLAVHRDYQGEGLMNRIVSHLCEIQYQRGNTHLFLYTKGGPAKLFSELGFYEIARTDDQVVFMENKKTGFSDYLCNLAKNIQKYPRIAGLVMNCNPFSLGHLHLVEKAASENDMVHLFIVSEDSSLFPFDVRKQLVLDGTAHIKNIRCHDSGSYIISSATFPSYFQKDTDAVIQSQALLDLAVFGRIAQTLCINCRYVGEEPDSQVTGIYNQIMKLKLPEYGISCIEIPRVKSGNEVISASTIRKAIKEADWVTVGRLVPDSTLKYLTSSAAGPVIEKIMKADSVVHY